MLSFLFAFGFRMAFATAETPDSWATYYELSGYTKTPRYAETIAYCRRLSGASPWVKYLTFGTSAQGRDLPLVVVSKDRAFTPEQAARQGKAVILIQSGIHAGEIDGKDASLMLIRDIAIRKTYSRLLDNTILLFVPMFNVDGHERFGPYNRINQNGPEEMGWRVTAQNINLNRDYMKADTPEMRAMLRLFSAWLPDFMIDCHVTDGIDFQYDLTYAVELGSNSKPVVSKWIRKDLVPPSIEQVERSGHKIFYYVFPREDKDLSKGLTAEAATPRFSTGYFALQNRPSLLIETHMLKPYKTRVEGTYELLKALIGTINADPRALRSAVREADEATIREGRTYDPASVYPLRFGLGGKSTPRRFLGVESHTERGEISGADFQHYTTSPREATIPFFDEITVEDSVSIPLAYLVPPEWNFVGNVLDAHGVHYKRLTQPATVEVESYSFSNVRWGAKPYEGRQVVTCSTKAIRERRTYPVGSLLVRMDQRAARVAMHLLEPRAPDSFVSWGFFNAIFEQKEYAESYVMEGIGRKMLSADPELRGEFENRLRADTLFAGNPRARLNWLYMRSPWRDPLLYVYPVVRVVTEEQFKTE